MHDLLNKLNPYNITSFTNWFLDNIKRIENGIIENNCLILEEIYEQISLLNYKKSIEFKIEYINNIFYLNLYHLNDKYLMNKTELIKEQLENRLDSNWSINLSF